MMTQFAEIFTREKKSNSLSSGKDISSTRNYNSLFCLVKIKRNFEKFEISSLSYDNTIISLKDKGWNLEIFVKYEILARIYR